MFSEKEDLLEVEWKSSRFDILKSLNLEFVDHVVDGLLVDGEESFHLISDFKVEGSLDWFLLFSAFNSKFLSDVFKILVFLSDILVLLSGNPLDKVGKDFVNGVSMDGELKWVDSHTSISELVEVSEVKVVWDQRVFGSHVGKMGRVSGGDFINELRSEEIPGFGHSWEEWLGQGEDSSGFLLHSPVDSGNWPIFMGQGSEGRIDERVDLLGRLEPGRISQLLPDGQISWGGVPEERDGSHSDLGMLGFVKGNRDKDGENSLLNKFVGQKVVDLSVDTSNFLHVFWDVQSLSGDDEVFEGKDGFHFEEAVWGLVKDPLNNGDDSWVSNVSKGVQVGNGEVLVFSGVGFPVLF